MRKSKPKVRKELFDELNAQIRFWNQRIDVEKEILADSKRAKNKAVRELLRLQKRYIAREMDMPTVIVRSHAHYYGYKKDI